MLRDTFVYWMFDGEGTCLYVGITKHPRQRWITHSRKWWISEVASKRMAGPFTSDVARRVERQQQNDLQPRYDMQQAAMRVHAEAFPPPVPASENGGFALNADRLQQEMRRRGIPNSAALARNINVNKSTAWRVMNGHSRPGPDFVNALLSAWDIEFHDIFDDPRKTRPSKVA